MKFYIIPVLQFGLPSLFVSPNLSRPIKQDEIITQCTHYFNTPYTDYLIPISGCMIEGTTIKSSQIDVVPLTNLPDTNGYYIMDTDDTNTLSLLREILEDDGYCLLQKFGYMAEFVRSVNTFSYQKEYDMALKYYWAHDFIQDTELSDYISSLVFDTETFRSKYELNASKLNEYARLASTLEDKEQQEFNLKLKKAEYDAKILSLSSEVESLESDLANSKKDEQAFKKELSDISQSRMLLSKGIVDDKAKPIHDNISNLYGSK